MRSSAQSLSTIEPERVCIIKPSSMGDVVHAMPILAALRGRWPSAHLSWVVNRPFSELLEGHRHLDELIVYDRGRRGIDRAGIGGMATLLGRLGRGRFDLTIDLQGLMRSALMVAATRARVRVGMADAREGARWFYTHRIDAPAWECTRSIVPCAVARALGADDSEASFNVPISAEARRWAAEVVTALPRPRIILNLGARVAHQTMAAGTFRRDRPPGGSRIRRGPDRRRLGRRSTARRFPAAPPRCRANAGPLRPDPASAARGPLPRVRPGDLQRHRTAPPRRRCGCTGPRHLYLHQPRAHRSPRGQGRLGPHRSLVCRQFPQDLQPARLHGGAPAWPRLAGRRRTSSGSPSSRAIRAPAD